MIARDLRIALGLANTVVRRLVTRGWLIVQRDAPTECRYAITSEGLRHKAQLETARLEETMSLFAETRDRLRDGLRQLTDGRCMATSAVHDAPTRVVLYGHDEMAQIVYLALRETDLQLVGVVHEQGGSSFLGLPVHPLDRLSATHLDAEPFSHVIVATPEPEAAVCARFARAGIEKDRLVFLSPGVSAGA